MPSKSTLVQGKYMRILLYNPDNGVTQNFMPHLWMFLLEALTPKGHNVVLIDATRNRWTMPNWSDSPSTGGLGWSESAP